MISPLALSSDARLFVDRFGKEEQPLLRVEDALADLELVRNIAARHSYKPIGPFYPGLRAAVSERIAMPLVDPLLGQIADIFELGHEPAYFECYLSIVTKAPGELDPIQRLPHFDGVERERIAVLLYLSDDSAGGTAFYRQRSTGFESVDGARYDRYLAELEAATAEHGIPRADYIGEDSPIFERTHKVDGVANRMIAYRGNSLHCFAADEAFLPIADPAKGRLTLNLFLTA